MTKKITKDTYRILGIDPGTAIVGWAILDVANEQTQNKPTVVVYGHIDTSKNEADENRLCEIADDITQIIRTHAPDVAAIEQLFFFKNQKTIITVAQARGVILQTCASNNLEIASYTPLQIKQSLTGYGRADKKQMQDMITRVLELKTVPKPDDTADALAVALCHNNSYKLLSSLKNAKG